MLALRKGLRSKAARDIVKKRLGRELPSGPTNKRIASTAAFSGGFSGLFANLERDIYAKALNRKLESGRGGFTSQEKKLLVGKVGKGTGKVKGFSEYYVTPRTHALGRGALGLLFGGPSGALAEGISGGAGTAINRRLWARALLARSRGGEKLTLQEKRLLGKLRRGK